MNRRIVGSKYLGIVFIDDNEDKILTLSIYPIKLTLEFYDNERLQIRLSIFKAELGLFIGYQ
tara:strand:+ start:240 stop:425 length:186 start_codon:yes stop_codon:yes gene_type:complete